MKTVKDLGGPAKVARLVDLKPPTVHGWKRVPERHCPAIEHGLHGSVTCEEIRPDIRWVRTPDPKWPNSAGRPLCDYAASLVPGVLECVGRDQPAANDSAAKGA